MNFLKKVWLSIEGYDLVRESEAILIACSGGCDSTGLALAMHEISQLNAKTGWKLHIGHFNHRLRGKESDGDQEFVRKLAEKLKLPYHSGAADVRRLKREEGLSLEEAGRKARYEWLTQTAIGIGAQKIALAHTLDDQAETILHRILRGTGLRGLRGIMAIRRLSRKHDLFAIRPLIETERDEIARYLRDRSQSFRTDSSNADLSMTRNRIRNVLIPMLEKEFNPRVKMALVKLGQTSGSFYILLREIADEVYENAKMLSPEGEVCLSVEEFRKLPPAIQTLIIDKAVKSVLGVLPHLNFEHYLEIIALCGEQAFSKAVRLPKGLEARRESYVLRICRPKAAPPPLKFSSLKLKVPGSTVIPKLHIRIDAEVMDGKVVGLSEYIRNKDFTEEILDYEKTAGPLVVRVRKKGDQFTPLGARGSTKLKKFFIDNKVPKTLRDRVPLLSDRERILWVVGYRLSNHVRITEDTQKVLKLKVVRLEGEEK